jgi:hypothetical protein
MKRLFCTVVTDFDGTLDSPIIFHIRTETVEKAEVCSRKLLAEYVYEDEELADRFNMFTFEVNDTDIEEV